MARLRSIKTRLQDMKIKFSKKRYWGDTPDAVMGFAPMTQAEADKRLNFEKDKIVEDLKTPPVKVNTTNISKQILDLRRLIISLKQKKLETSIFEKAIKQLENRKIFNKIEKDIGTFPITTQEKIDGLAQKYKLVFKNLEGITKEMPLFAVNQLEKFCRPIEKEGIEFEKRDFYLIAPEDWWQRKRDPILLVESPFGNYFYIVCAWDKEVDIVGELFK